jgi:hypothetical protein
MHNIYMNMIMCQKHKEEPASFLKPDFYTPARQAINTPLRTDRFPVVNKPIPLVL